MIARFFRWVLLLIFTIRERDTDFARMGIDIGRDQEPGLKAIVEAFRSGFNLALADDDQSTLKARMETAFDPHFRFFAYEGVGMAMTLLDWFSDRGRVQAYLPRVTPMHEHMLGLGVGFALARVPWVRGGAEAYARRFPPGLDGMIFNGYGFHEGCFKSRGRIEDVARPALSPEALRAFDHGLGRALWFVNGAEPWRIRASLEKIAPERHPDLWAGMGTACCFAGRAYADLAAYDRVLRELDDMAGDESRAALRLGVMLAALLQVRVGTVLPWVQRACEIVVGMPAVEVGARAEQIWQESVTDPTLASVPFAAYQHAGDTMMAAIAPAVGKAGR